MSLHSKKLFINKRKKVLKKALVGISLFLCGALSLYSICAFASFFFPLNPLFHPLFTILIMTFLSLIAYKPLDSLFTEIFKHYLFKKKSYVHMMLMHLTEELELILDLQELANLVVNTFGELMHLKTVALLVAEESKQGFYVASAYGWSVSDYRRVHFHPGSPLLELIRNGGPHVVVRNRVDRAVDWQESNRLARDFDKVQANWIIPLWVDRDIQGFLAFSALRPEEHVFDEMDFRFFRRFAYILARRVYTAISFLKFKKANEILQDTQSKLVQVTKLAAIEQLATGLAHQIHNPLTIISGKAQVLLLQKDRVPMDDRVTTVLKTIVEQTKRAADITKKLLMFSQTPSVTKELLDLGQVLEDTVSLISYQTSLDGIEIKKTVNANLPRVLANVQEMREVFFNLILNAVQSVESHGQIHVSIRCETVDRVIEVQVSDTGRGIEKENIDKLFNPFFTTRHEALGLGLFVTKQIVHRSGGSIRVESRPQEGSLFIVRIPCADIATENCSRKLSGKGSTSPSWPSAVP